jgi:hypothetical protein
MTVEGRSSAGFGLAPEERYVYRQNSSPIRTAVQSQKADNQLHHRQQVKVGKLSW